MNTELIFIAKLLIAHYLVLDFPLASGWLVRKDGVKFAPIFILIPILVAGLSWALLGWEYWNIAIVILASHLLAAVWYITTDKKLKHTFWVQGVQMLIILGCWWFTFYKKADILLNWNAINKSPDFWVITTALFFLTWPAAFIIGKLLEQWTTHLSQSAGTKEKIIAAQKPILKAQNLSVAAMEQLTKTIDSVEQARAIITTAEASISKLKSTLEEATQKTSAIADEPDRNESLINAGKWIGIIERVILFILVMIDQYEALGLLIAAKTIIRFNESDRQEKKTEYLLIGTLTSVSLAIITGILVVKVLR
ncbi:MAG: hypothetical protein ABIR18_10010 [Chitinophagaceae bacterium]